jgi:hypothetical protein
LDLVPGHNFDSENEKIVIVEIKSEKLTDVMHRVTPPWEDVMQNPYEQLSMYATFVR